MCPRKAMDFVAIGIMGSYLGTVHPCREYGAAYALIPWSWPLLGLMIQLPFVACVPACAAGLAAATSQSSVHLLLPPIALAVLQWAEEGVRRRHFLVKQLQTHAPGQMKGVAENLMPPCVVNELRWSKHRAADDGVPRSPTSPSVGGSLVAHSYDILTYLQADLVGFTKFARSRSPEEVVCVINGLFSIFDSFVNAKSVYKMETIGDAYVCVSGLPDDNGGKHSAAAMLLLAADFVSAVGHYKTKCSLPPTLGLRVGIHSGRCIGGIVGASMKRYHLFGRTVRIAELLESTAPINGIQCSATTKDYAEKEHDCPQFSLEEVDPESELKTSKNEVVDRADIDDLHTYLLDAERPVEASDGSDADVCSGYQRHTDPLPVIGLAEELGMPAQLSYEVGQPKASAQKRLSDFGVADCQSAQRAYSKASAMMDQLDRAVRWHAEVSGTASTRLMALRPKEQLHSAAQVADKTWHVGSFRHDDNEDADEEPPTLLRRKRRHVSIS